MGDRFGGVDWIILDTNFPSYAHVLQTKHAPASRKCPRSGYLPNSAMATLGLKEMGKFLWEGREKGLPCWLSQFRKKSLVL